MPGLVHNMDAPVNPMVATLLLALHSVGFFHADDGEQSSDGCAGELPQVLGIFSHNGLTLWAWVTS